tara:strand:+ start:638 stop:868 length:231 start_codon:yes stop_codon:yes gene_type:complete
MPVYTLLNKETNEEHDITVKYDELQTILEDTNLQRVFKPNQFITIHGSVMSRTDGDFRSHLKSIKKKYPGNTIDNS